MKKLICILLVLISCLSFGIAEEDIPSDVKALGDWFSKTENMRMVRNDCSTLRPGMKFTKLVINDIYYNISEMCEIVEIKPETDSTYKLVYSQLVRLHSEWTDYSNYYDSKDKKLDSITLQYKTIYLSKYDDIEITLREFYLEPGNTIIYVVGYVNKGTYNEINLQLESYGVYPGAAFYTDDIW